MPNSKKKNESSARSFSIFVNDEPLWTYPQRINFGQIQSTIRDPESMYLVGRIQCINGFFATNVECIYSCIRGILLLSALLKKNESSARSFSIFAKAEPSWSYPQRINFGQIQCPLKDPESMYLVERIPYTTYSHKTIAVSQQGSLPSRVGSRIHNNHLLRGQAFQGLQAAQARGERHKENFFKKKRIKYLHIENIAYICIRFTMAIR